MSINFLAHLVSGLSKLSNDEKVNYRDLLGVLLKYSHLYMAGSHPYQIYVNEAGPWSIQCARDLNRLQDEGAIDIYEEKSKTGVDMIIIKPNGKMAEYCHGAQSNEGVKLNKLIQNIGKSQIESHVPWRWAVFNVFDEMRSVVYDNDVQSFADIVE